MKKSAMWWKDRKDELMALCHDSSPLLVYNEETLNDLFFDLLSMDSIDRHLYAAGANPHPGILTKAFEMGLDFLIRNPEEEEQVRTSCPGITPDRFFSIPQALSFPRLLIRNRPGAPLERPGSDGDIRDDVEEIERIKEACPDAEIGFICGPRELSPAGVLIMRSAGQMNRIHHFLVALGAELSERRGVNKGTLSMEIFNLSDPDLNPIPLQSLLGTDRKNAGVACRIAVSEPIKTGDILLIRGMGAFFSMSISNKALNAKDQAMEHFLQARKMCQVKI